MARGTAESAGGRCGSRCTAVAASSSAMKARARAGIDLRGTRRSRRQRSTADCSPPEARPAVAGGVEQRRHLLALRLRLRGRRRRAARRLDGPGIGHRLAAPEELLREIPHHTARNGEPREISAAQAADLAGALGDAGDRGGDVDRRQIGVDRRPVGRTPRHSPTGAHRAGGGMGVGRRQRLVGEPGVGDEAAGAGGVRHVAAEQRVDAEDRLGDRPVEALVRSGAGSRLPSALALPSFTAPHQT